MKFSAAVLLFINLFTLQAAPAADPETLIVAGGTSCRHQIVEGAARKAEHVACVLDRASAPAS